MLYSFFKIWIRCALAVFCRRVTFNHPGWLSAKGPVLLACNHPNSFLDAIIVGSYCKHPVHFLARGDAFRKPFVRGILRALKLIPIYRLSEGREYLALNEATFTQCREILSKGGIVLIFAEGLCVNQWALRPLKKGAARIALDAWENHGIADQFRVLPVSLNYNSFTEFGKRVIINFGDPINEADLNTETQGERVSAFNSLLSQRLAHGMLQSAGDPRIVQSLLSNYSESVEQLKIRQRQLENTSFQNRMDRAKAPYLLAGSRQVLFFSIFALFLWALPALAGWVIHAPLYYPLRRYLKGKTEGTVFFDSVMFGTLLFLYPVYWLLINLIVWLFSQNKYLHICFVLMPLFAWAFLAERDCWQRIWNYWVVNGPGKNKPYPKGD